MSISALSYTPGVAEIKDIASKVAFAKQVTDLAGTDLGTPDTFGQFPLLSDFEFNPEASERTGNFWDQDEYILGTTEKGTGKLVVLSRMKAVVQDMVQAVKGNTYVFLVEQFNQAVNGKYQLAALIGEFTSYPGLKRDPAKEFGIKFYRPTADIVIDIKAAEAQLGALAIALPVGASVTIPEGEFFGLYEVDWPSS